MKRQPKALAWLLSGAIVLSACAGSASPEIVDRAVSPAQSSQTASEAESASSDGITRFPGMSEDIPLVAGFIPELADLPVPDVAAFQPGAAYTAEQDPRETAVQRVEFLLQPEELATFYFDALEAQGYVVASGSQPSSVEQLAEIISEGATSYTLVFDGPDGIPLQLTIGPSPIGATSTMNINRYRSGSR